MFGKNKIDKVKEYLIDNSKSLIDYFNTHDIFQKIVECAKTAGATFIYRVLIIYYTLKLGKLPVASVAIVTAALGYFLLPVDIIPDFMGVIGFSDDAIALGLAMNEIRKFITPEIIAEADNKLLSFFPSVEIPSLEEL